MYALLADFVVILHLGFILFVTFGALLALRWKKVIWVHVPAFVWGALTEFLGLICPLTPLENYLRHMGSGQRYGGGFINHYLLPLIYPAGLTQELQWLLGAALVCTNLLIYGFLWRRYVTNRNSEISPATEKH